MALLASPINNEKVSEVQFDKNLNYFKSLI